MRKPVTGISPALPPDSRGFALVLLQLRVKAIGIIEDINWALGPGLNVITGETGVGKSLIIDAVEALLAGRVEEDLIRHGADRAYLEGVFTLPQDDAVSPLRELLADKGLNADEETLVINCEPRRQGRGIIRVNGYAVTRGVLNQIGSLLVDIHGQSEHLSLLDKSYHRYLLDCYGHTLDLGRSFGARAQELRKAEEELRVLVDEEKERARREEFLRFQLDEIKRAELHEGEEEALQGERNILAASEQLKALSFEACQTLCGEGAAGSSAPVLEKLSEAVRTVKKLVGLDPALKKQLDFLEESLYGLEETARDIRAYGERLEYDPKRLEEIETRLELIRGLKRKYGQSVPEILDYLEKAGREMAEISHSGERKAALIETCSRLREELGRMAAELSQQRCRAAKQLLTEVERELGDLNMSQVKFEVAITREPDPEGIPSPEGGSYAYSNSGVDIVEFLAATNPGEPLKPLIKIASTGEISRFALALKSALTGADNIPVLIFDEIDIGVGGRSGEVIGKKLWNLARNHQVICVTHLPQIAAFADAHYSVHKDVSGARTLSRLDVLEGNARIEELAAMLAGPQYSETARENARELIQRAVLWKEHPGKKT
ncbi:MAG: DNA repair protein RecN [Dehalococcoidales bacterium]|nr:DNA repair protein RecN [Dehalococcoidales bacterium]